LKVAALIDTALLLEKTRRRDFSEASFGEHSLKEVLGSED
jgi:hypothetical protein